MTKINLIYAQSANGYIGKDNQLPWHLPEDLKRFKELTTGHAVIMGRKTWDSLPEQYRPLPGRANLIATRNTMFHWYAPVGVITDFTTFLEYFKKKIFSDDVLWVIGGAELFQQVMPYADEIYVTEVHIDIEGDAKAPQIDENEFQLVEESPVQVSEKNYLFYQFKKYIRK